MNLDEIAEKRFYNHDKNIDLEARFNSYSEFLEDGDFEYWQPVCYMDLNDAEKVRKFKRFQWIAMRFPKWQSEIWTALARYDKRLRADLGEVTRPNGLPTLMPPTFEKLSNDLVNLGILTVIDGCLFLSDEMKAKLVS